MKTRKYSSLFVVIFLLLTGCQPVVTANLQPTQPQQIPSALPLNEHTEPFEQPPVAAQTGFTLDYSAVAKKVNIELVPAQPEGAGGPYWEVAPQYYRLTLEGYPVGSTGYVPQIDIYPVEELASANEGAGKIIADLQTLLKPQQIGDHLPFLPLNNASQVMHTQVQYLDFKGGTGIRYLTQFAQAIMPVNNQALIYTFQGLSSDGKYYIAAVLPVNNPELPAGPEISEQLANQFNDFSGYLAGVVDLLDQQSAESFTPDLNQLDAMIRSIEVQ